MRFYWKQIVPALLAGALIGGILGARCQLRAFQCSQRGPDVNRFMAKMSRELGLDAKQQPIIKAIVEKNHEKMLAVHRETSARLADIRMAMRADIAKALTVEQQQKFEAMVARWEAHHPDRFAAAPPSSDAP